MKNLKYLEHSIVMEEVPDEISLAINISGCQHNCVGCHSPHMHSDDGRPLCDDIDKLIEPYKNDITCVCFMGGDHNLNELICLCDYVKAKYKLKTCVYTGYDYIANLKDLPLHVDYLKIGSYQAGFGGLDSPSTNQRMYEHSANMNGEFKDITYKFWRNQHDTNKN